MQEKFHEDWSKDQTWGWQQNRAVIGHNLKIAWNLMRINALAPKDKYVALARKIADLMPFAGEDRQRGGWYDVVERVLGPGEKFHRYAWHDRKAWWQQEQGILAYLILHGCVGQEEYLRHARESSAFYNAFFLDHDDGAVYFNVLANGIPYLMGTERFKGSHSMSGYHSFELAFLAATYTNLLINKVPMDFYFKPRPDGFNGNMLRVAPDLLPEGSIRIDRRHRRRRALHRLRCRRAHRGRARRGRASSRSPSLPYRAHAIHMKIDHHPQAHATPSSPSTGADRRQDRPGGAGRDGPGARRECSVLVLDLTRRGLHVQRGPAHAAAPPPPAHRAEGQGRPGRAGGRDPRRPCASPAFSSSSRPAPPWPRSNADAAPPQQDMDTRIDVYPTHEIAGYKVRAGHPATLWSHAGARRRELLDLLAPRHRLLARALPQGGTHPVRGAALPRPSSASATCSA